VRGEDKPVATFDYPGSVNDVDINPDGNRVAVATKASHANLSMAGGTIDLYAFNDEDFVVRGVPHAGDQLSIEMSSVPNSPARLLVAPMPAVTPFTWGNVGTLYLNRHTMYSLPMGMTGPHGYASGTFQISALPGVVGTTLCFQGLATSPRRLTQSWVRLTVVP